MKFTVLILSYFLFGLCNSDPIEINKATSQEIIGGVQGSGKTIEYRVEIELLKNPEKLNITGMIINGKYFDAFKLIPEDNSLIHYKKREQKKYLSSAGKKDRVTISFADHQKMDNNENMIPAPTRDFDVPDDLKGKNMIIYQWKGKEKYTRIPALTKKEPQYMP
ncbi:MAG: hypothetical protein K9H84_06735 [Bacteroidales bacterium]|nr:hypothetical protein [Bacteroidales bacterium]